MLCGFAVACICSVALGGANYLCESFDQCAAYFGSGIIAVLSHLPKMVVRLLDLVGEWSFQKPTDRLSTVELLASLNFLHLISCLLPEGLIQY